MAEYQIPGLSLGIVQDGEMPYVQGYGLRTINTQDSVRAQSVFHTASISKLFTAQSIMMLVEKKKLQLNTLLVDIIPEIEYKDSQARQIQLLHLLNHTSGLPDIANYHWKKQHTSDSSLRTYVSKLKVKVRSKPGEKYNYSNLGYNILAYVVEKTSGQLFEDFVKENIMAPANMANSDFRLSEISKSLRVSPHLKKGEELIVSPVYPYSREHAGSSTLQASAEDLSKWMIGFLQGLSSKPDTYQAQMIKAPNSNFPFIGLGFQLASLDNWRKIGHYGGDRGFRSYLFMVPEAKLGIVVLGNAGFHEDFRQEIGHGLARLLLNTNWYDL